MNAPSYSFYDDLVTIEDDKAGEFNVRYLWLFHCRSPFQLLE